MQRLVIMLCFLCLSHISYSQFSISGSVTDSDGNPLVGASIAIENTFSGAICDNAGKFTFSNLKAGNYTLVCLYLGYESEKQTVTLSKNEILSFKLKASEILTDEVIVSATRANDKSPMAHTTVEKSELSQQNSGQDVPYLLNLTPSLVVTSDAGGGVGYTGLRIRGTDLNRINVTMNGIPFNDAESHSVYWVDIPDFTSSVENVQIQRGVGTSTNGAAAFGGTINFQTLSVNKTPYVELNNSYGSFNTLKNSIIAGTGLLKNRFTFDARLSNIQSDGYVDRATSDLKSFFVSGGYYFNNQFVKLNVFSGKEKTYQSWYGIPKASLDTNRTFNPYTYPNQIDDYKQTNYQLFYSNQISKSLNINLAAHYTHGEGFYEQKEYGENFADYQMDNVISGTDTITESDLITQKWLKNDFYGFTASLHYIKNQVDAVVGGGWNQYDGKHFGEVTWAQYHTNPWQSYCWYNGDGLKTDANIYAKINYQITKRFNVYADAQFRKIDYKIDGIDDNLRDISQNHNYNFFNPKAGIFFSITDNQNVYLSFSVANREPNRSNLTDAEPAKRPTYETLYDFEYGYALKMSKIRFDANFFDMSYKNQLVMTGEINDVGAAIMVNVPKSYRRGAEVSVVAKITDKLQYLANVSISTNKIQNFTEYVDDWTTWAQRSENLGNTDLSFSPNTIINSQISYSPLKFMNMSFSSKYVGKQYIDNTSSNERSISAYFVNDFQVSFQFHTKFVKEIDINLFINNLLNEKYETNAWVYSYYEDNQRKVLDGYFPQAGRNFMTSLLLKF